jgi:hypothetical protein
VLLTPDHARGEEVVHSALENERASPRARAWLVKASTLCRRCQAEHTTVGADPLGHAQAAPNLADSVEIAVFVDGARRATALDHRLPLLLLLLLLRGGRRRGAAGRRWPLQDQEGRSRDVGRGAAEQPHRLLHHAEAAVAELAYAAAPQQAPPAAPPAARGAPPPPLVVESYTPLR